MRPRLVAEPSAPAGPPSSRHTLSHREILLVLSGLLTAVFTALLATTIVMMALPTIAAELHASSTQLTWIVTVALLANAISTPIWGKLADLSDQKSLIQAALLALATGSVLAGCAPSMTALLAARALQGIGMGGTVAVTVAALSRIIAPREQGRYSGYLAAVIAVSMAGGPLLGGLLVDSVLGWRACFLICAPLAVVASVVLRRTRLPAIDRNSNVRIDWLGATLLAASVSILLIWISFTGRSGQHGWYSWQSAGYLALAGGLLGAALFVEARAADPILPLKIITERTTACTIVASVTVGIGFYAIHAFLGQYLQIVRGQSPTTAGLSTIPMVLGLSAASVVSGHLITRFGRWKVFLLAGALLQVGGFGVLGTVDQTTAPWLIGFAITLIGLGAGMLLNNLLLPVQNTVSVDHIGAASSSIMFFRSFGGAVGLPALAALLTNQITTRSAELGLPTPVPRAGVEAVDPSSVAATGAVVLRHAYSDALGLVFLVVAAIALVCVVAVLLIPNRALRTTLEPVGEQTTARSRAD